MLSRFSKKFSVQLFLLFGGFMTCRILCNAIFYEGFLTTFRNLNGYFTSVGSTTLFAHDPFHSWSIILSALLQPYFLLLVLLLYLPFYLKRKELMPMVKQVRVWEKLIPFACALLLVWEMCTYERNYYLDSGFYFDRVLLLILALLILRSPFFVPLFIASAFVYRAQFNYPVDGFPLFDKRLLFDLLEMFLVWFYLRLFIRNLKVPFLFATLCIIGSNYFMSFMGKIFFISPFGDQWLTHDRITDLFANVHLRGWITNENTYQTMYAFLQKFDCLFRVLIILVEFSGILLLWRRKWSIAFLISFFFMHIGIFIFGSMLFWKWMVVDALVVFMLIRYKNEFEELFTKRFRRAFLVMIVTSFIWLQPYRIAWWDTSATQLFHYVAIDDQGNELNVDKNMFNPYHQWFEYDHFEFLVNKPLSPLTGFGYVSSYFLKQEIDSCKNDSLYIYPRSCRNLYSGQKKKEFDSFIATYFHNRNDHKGSTSFFAAPDHLHSSVTAPAYDGTQHIKTFRVYFVQAKHVGAKVAILRDELIDEIIIP